MSPMVPMMALVSSSCVSDSPRRYSALPSYAASVSVRLGSLQGHKAQDE